MSYDSQSEILHQLALEYADMDPPPGYKPRTPAASSKDASPANKSVRANPPRVIPARGYPAVGRGRSRPIFDARDYDPPAFDHGNGAGVTVGRPYGVRRPMPPPAESQGYGGIMRSRFARPHGLPADDERLVFPGARDRDAENEGSVGRGAIVRPKPVVRLPPALAKVVQPVVRLPPAPAKGMQAQGNRSFESAGSASGRSRFEAARPHSKPSGERSCNSS
jgi:hypothetical protein